MSGSCPWNLGICYLTWQNGLGRCDRVKDLRWGDDPGLQGGSSVITGVLMRERQEGQRRSYHRSRSQSGVNTGGPLILGREWMGSPPKLPEGTQLALQHSDLSPAKHMSDF